MKPIITTFFSPSGHQVLVGRNAVSNEYLSTHLLESKDLWFHAKDVPGSHVVLKYSDQKISDKDIAYCESLARKYSRDPGCKHVIKTSGKKVVKNTSDALGTVTIM